MSRLKSSRIQRKKRPDAYPAPKIEIPPDTAKKEKHYGIFVAAALLAFGVYQSVLYFGHTIVPISDFPDYVRLGQELLSFKVPASFKLAPVVGTLQVCLSHFVGGQFPALTAGWLLNAILHPFNLLLLWLVARELVGKSAPWLALIAIINPWTIYLLTEPIIETTLLFSVLLSLYLIFKRSKWAYLVAATGTMVRYECAALILAAFVTEMIYSSSRRQRITAFLYSVAACIPLAVWLLGTVLTWRSGTTHYFNVLFTKEYAKGFVEPVENRTGLLLHMNILWRTGFYPLLTPYPGSSENAVEVIWRFSRIFVVGGFFFGAIYGLCKRQWKILALLIFFVPYFVLHARYPYPLQRYHATIFWIVLFIGWFGFVGVWRLVDRDGRVPRVIAFILQALVLLTAVIWVVQLLPYLPKISAMSPRSASVPYVAMGLVGLIFGARVFIYRTGFILRELAILTAVSLVIVSNQFMLVRLLSDGQREVEFKLLADWYAANAKPGEKMGVYMAGTVRIFAPRYADDIVELPKAASPEEFVKTCLEKNITYVVWATREGLSTDHTAYRQIGLDKNIACLAEARSVGPYEFIGQVGSERGYVNIYRLKKPADR